MDPPPFALASYFYARAFQLIVANTPTHLDQILKMETKPSSKKTELRTPPINWGVDGVEGGQTNG